MDAKDIALIKALGGGGVSSWNDLKDKPFYEESKTLLEWDGDTTGHETIDLAGTTYVHLEMTGSIEDVVGSTLTIVAGDETLSTVLEGEYAPVKINENGTLYSIEPVYIFIVLEDNVQIVEGGETTTFPYAGWYVMHPDVFGGYFSSIVKTVIKRIDNKFLPTVCGKTADAEGNISLEASDVGAAKLFVVTETSDGVVDKSGEQIRDAYLAGNVVILVPRERFAKIMYLLTVGIKGHINPEGYMFFSVGISSDINIPYFRTATVYSDNTVKYKTEELARYESSRSSITLDSSTEGSTKRFNITVDDSGTISAKEI